MLPEKPVDVLEAKDSLTFNLLFIYLDFSTCRGCAVKNQLSKAFAENLGDSCYVWDGREVQSALPQPYPDAVQSERSAPSQSKQDIRAAPVWL